MKEVKVIVQPNLVVLLFLIFLTLKLCGVIDWSWWWVFCPLWAIPAAMLVFVGTLLLAVVMVKIWRALSKKFG